MWKSLGQQIISQHHYLKFFVASCLDTANTPHLTPHAYCRLPLTPVLSTQTPNPAVISSLPLSSGFSPQLRGG